MSEVEKRFRILHDTRIKCKVTSVPWSFVEPHRATANLNHSQSLERLNERGGLSPYELRCAVNDFRWRQAPKDWDDKNSTQWLEELFPESKQL